MAVLLEGGCRVSEMREGEPLIEGALRIWSRIGHATGAQAISLRVLEFAPGLSPGIQNENCDEILYVLNQHWDFARTNRNEVSTTRVSGWVNAFINGYEYQVGADTGIYLRPHEMFAIDNPGPHSVVLISSQCPDPDRAPQFVPPLTAPPADSSPPDRPPLVRLPDRPAQSTADRWYRVMVDDEVGSAQVTQFVGSIPPGRAP